MAISDSTPIQLPLAIDDATVEMQLTQGYSTIIDAVDADLCAHLWQADLCDGRIYATRRIGTRRDRKKQYLHRVILERKLGRALIKDEYADHKDRNTLHNWRDNLRLASGTQNSANKSMQSNNTSGYKGVTFCKQTGRWRAQIQYKGRHIPIGRFDTRELAYVAYCMKAEELFGEFAHFD